MSLEDALAEEHANYTAVAERCRRYREAYNALRVHHDQECPAKLAAVRRKREDEMLLLSAELRARNEETELLRKRCSDQERELAEMRPALTLFREQVAAKDTLLKQQAAEVAKGEALRSFNMQLITEMRRLNAQLAAESSRDEATQQVARLSAELDQARWKHNMYEAALGVLQKRVDEMGGFKTEKKVK